jgi:hypothetical protein
MDVIPADGQPMPMTAGKTVMLLDVDVVGDDVL